MDETGKIYEIQTESWNNGLVIKTVNETKNKLEAIEYLEKWTEIFEATTDNVAVIMTVRKERKNER